MADDGFTPGFDDAGAYEIALGLEVSLAHAVFVFLEVADFTPGIFTRFGVFGQEALGFFHDSFDLPLVQFVPPSVFVLVEAFEVALKEELA